MHNYRLHQSRSRTGVEPGSCHPRKLILQRHSTVEQPREYACMLFFHGLARCIQVVDGPWQKAGRQRKRASKSWSRRPCATHQARPATCQILRSGPLDWGTLAWECRSARGILRRGLWRRSDGLPNRVKWHWRRRPSLDLWADGLHEAQLTCASRVQHWPQVDPTISMHSTLSFSVQSSTRFAASSEPVHQADFE